MAIYMTIPFNAPKLLAPRNDHIPTIHISIKSCVMPLIDRYNHSVIRPVNTGGIKNNALFKVVLSPFLPVNAKKYPAKSINETIRP